MKKMVKAMACAFAALIAMPVFAQTTANVEPARISAEEISLVSNIINGKTAVQNQISKRDSMWFSRLLANGNNPICWAVTEQFISDGKEFLPGDSVCTCIIRTPKGFCVQYRGVRNVTKKMTVVAEDSVKARVPGEPAMQGKAVARTRRTVTEKDGNKTATYTRTTMDKVSDEYIERVNAGEAKLFDNVSTDVEGRKISKLYAEINGGANFAFKGSELHPQFGIVLGWETKSMIFALRGNLSWSSYNQTAEEGELSEVHHVVKNAEVSGRYPKYEAKAELGYKMWQSVRYTDYVAAYVAAGLGGCRTDGESAVASSTLIGFCAEAGIEVKYSLTKNFALTGNVGGNLINKNFHDSKQDANFGIFASVGGRVSF